MSWLFFHFGGLRLVLTTFDSALRQLLFENSFLCSSEVWLGYGHTVHSYRHQRFYHLCITLSCQYHSWTIVFWEGEGGGRT